MISSRKASASERGRYTHSGFVSMGDNKKQNSHPRGSNSGVIVIILATLAIAGCGLSYLATLVP